MAKSKNPEKTKRKKLSKEEKAERRKKRRQAAREKAAQYKRKAVGLLIGLIALILLIIVLFFAFSRIFRAQDIAELLPQDSVVALVQVNIEPTHQQVQRFFEALNKYPQYDSDNLKVLISEMFDVDFEEEIIPWIGRQVGFALVEKPEFTGDTEMLFFIETRGKNETLAFMETRGLQNQEDYILNDDYRGVDIYRYSLSQDFRFMFLNKYLIVGMNEEILKHIVDNVHVGRQTLVDNPKYQKVAHNLPITALMFAYIDVEKGIKVLKNNPDFMVERGRALISFEPFLKLYRSFGLSIVMQKSDLTIQSFTALNEDYLDGQELVVFGEKFRADLLNLVSDQPIFYAGGLNLQKQIRRYSEVFGNGSNISFLIFEGLIRAQKDTYLGEEISLEEDVYPLLTKEYGLLVSEQDDKQLVTLLLELEDPARDKEIIESIATSFIRKSAILAPKIVEVELEDGTIAEEIQTSAEEIVSSTESYKGFDINVLTIGTQPWGIHYVILDDRLVASSHIDPVKDAIDLLENTAGSFRNTALYRDSIDPVLRSSDEVMFMNVAFMLEQAQDMLPEGIDFFAMPFSHVSTGKNYFKDGISTIHFIKIN